LIEIGLLVLEKILKTISAYFYSLAIISPWGRGLSFICTILNPLCLRMICANFGQKWPSGPGEGVENVKVYRQTDRQMMDNRQSEKFT
jgi:hypothetical protein